MQLDIFNDSRDVMLRNDVLSALQQYDAAGARLALQALANEYPDGAARVYFGSIVNVLEGRSTVPFDRHEAARHARQALSHEVQPAVARVFPGQTGATWLAPLGAELAWRAAALPFRSDHLMRTRRRSSCLLRGGLRRVLRYAHRVLATHSSAALLDDGVALPDRRTGRGLAVAGGTCVAFAIPGRKKGPARRGPGRDGAKTDGEPSGQPRLCPVLRSRAVSTDHVYRIVTAPARDGLFHVLRGDC
jgi:hypothetical protein